MSVNTWKNLEGSKQTSKDKEDGAMPKKHSMLFDTASLYDGSQTLEQAWFEGLKPDAFMT